MEEGLLFMDHVRTDREMEVWGTQIMTGCGCVDTTARRSAWLGMI